MQASLYTNGVRLSGFLGPQTVYFVEATVFSHQKLLSTKHSRMVGEDRVPGGDLYHLNTSYGLFSWETEELTMTLTASNKQACSWISFWLPCSLWLKTHTAQIVLYDRI